MIDLDGTLANIDHRLHFVTGEKKNYDAFYGAVSGDTVNDWCRLTMALFEKQGFKVIIVSARRQNTEETTRYWLAENNVKYSRLELLRPDGDSTPDQELKRAWLKSYGAERVIFVVDDREKVCRMWREEGLTVLRCSDWKETKLDPKEVEIVAEECHRQWSGWTEHFLFKTEDCCFKHVSLDKVWKERWTRQINTPYAQLSKEEKDADRREARNILTALKEKS